MEQKNRKLKNSKLKNSKPKEVLTATAPTEAELERAHKLDFMKAIKLKKFVPVRGYDFDKGFEIKSFLKAFKQTGFQATNLGIAIDLIKKMRREKCAIILTYTSNLVTSGIRDIIRWLVQHKHVHALCTTGGGIEEDIMKCFGPFVLGHFEADAKELYVRGLNRTGNIYVSDELYIKFEQWLLPILEYFYERQKRSGKIVSSIELVQEFGRRLEKEKRKTSSIVYWAYKNKIPLFSPSFLDGAIGDIVWFFKHKHKDFKIDVSEDLFNMNNWPFKASETGLIALGSGTPRHYALNAHIFKGGVKYAVYITTSNEWDGSTSSSKPSEAYTWGKIKLFEPYEKNSVHVEGDVTIIFPLIVAGVWGK
ncbi:MAG: deoxyhypusine synthase [Candidatus Pacearchaeota archaeon]